LTRSCTEGAFVLPAGCTKTALHRPPVGLCIEASWSCRAVPLALAEGTGCIRDAELSACCTAVASIRACASWHRLRPSGVEGSGIAQSRKAAAVSFLLALGWLVGRSSRCPPGSAPWRHVLPLEHPHRARCVLARERRAASVFADAPPQSWPQAPEVAPAVPAASPRLPRLLTGTP
jgi:hypothetical protein